jgi:hypothetical protein
MLQSSRTSAELSCWCWQQKLKMPTVRCRDANASVHKRKARRGRSSRDSGRKISRKGKALNTERTESRGCVVSTASWACTAAVPAAISAEGKRAVWHGTTLGPGLTQAWWASVHVGKGKAADSYEYFRQMIGKRIPPKCVPLELLLAEERSLQLLAARPLFKDFPIMG